MMPDVRLIDANALKRLIKSGDDLIFDHATECEILHMIDYQETIDAQPVKHGKWEWEPGYVGTTAKCSACGLSPLGFYSLPKIQIGRLPEYKFCPNCGADMRDDDADS